MIFTFLQRSTFHLFLVLFNKQSLIFHISLKILDGIVLTLVNQPRVAVGGAFAVLFPGRDLRKKTLTNMGHSRTIHNMISCINGEEYGLSKTKIQNKVNTETPSPQTPPRYLATLATTFLEFLPANCRTSSAH